MTGLATVVEVTRADKSLDTLQVDTRLGNDSIFIAPQVHNLLTFSVRSSRPARDDLGEHRSRRR